MARTPISGSAKRRRSYRPTSRSGPRAALRSRSFIEPRWRSGPKTTGAQGIGTIRPAAPDPEGFDLAIGRDDVHQADARLIPNHPALHGPGRQGPRTDDFFGPRVQLLSDDTLHGMAMRRAWRFAPSKRQG